MYPKVLTHDLYLWLRVGAGIGGLLDRVREMLLHNLFSLTLTAATGNLFLGMFDPIVNHAQWLFTPVEDDPEGHWVVAASINGVQMPKHAVVDSGTTAILLSHDIAKQVLNKMAVTQTIQQDMLLGIFDCDRPAKITVQVGKYTRTLNAASSMFGNLNQTVCYSSVVGVSPDTDLGQSAILGGPFFTSKLRRGQQCNDCVPY